jgi:hypothetical protein
MHATGMPATGRCLCGAVTFTAHDVDLGMHVCHCSMCRMWAGGPTFSVACSRVEFRGEEHVTRFASSEWAERGFCDRCGSNLFYRLVQRDQYILQMGSFDDQAAFRVASEIYVDDKPVGYDLAGTHPRMTGEAFLASLKH